LKNEPQDILVGAANAETVAVLLLQCELEVLGRISRSIPRKRVCDAFYGERKVRRAIEDNLDNLCATRSDIVAIDKDKFPKLPYRVTSSPPEAAWMSEQTWTLGRA
jgi:hypothetical protein